jgi:hypothetical protein
MSSVGSINTTEQITEQMTLRRKSNNPPQNRADWETNYTIETFTTVITFTMPPPLPTLQRTDTDGYYCRKRAAGMMLEELIETGLTLEQALQEKCRFFLERPGGTERYNETDYVSQDCALCIEALLTAYEKMLTP